MKTAPKNVCFDSVEVEKKLYLKPQLTVYGKLSEFTAGGTAKNPEQNPTQTNLQRA